MRIVYIEDEPEMIDLVRLILGRKGYELIGATSGRDGIAVIQQELPDLVLLDLMMPGMDGWDVYHQMRGLDALVRDLLKRFPSAMWRPASMNQPVRLEGYTLIFSEGMSRQRHPLTAVRGLDLQEEYSFWSGVKFRSRVRLSGNQERTFNGIQAFILLFNWTRKEPAA